MAENQETPGEKNSTAVGDGLKRCLDAAVRFLACRPRSEQELKLRLRRRGFNPGDIDSAVARLKEKGLLNDAAFARFWTDNREAFRPRSRRLTRMELKQKGVAEDTITEAVSGISDEDSAYRAALGRARSLPGTDFEDFRRRLGGYLKRRGFYYEDIESAIKRVRQELGGREQPSL